MKITKKIELKMLVHNRKFLHIAEIFIPILFGVCVLGGLTFYKLNFGIGLMESDSASDIFYAHLLSKEGRVISNNWFFSTEIRILDNELVFALLFRLFPRLGWWKIETIGTAIMNGLMGLSGVMLAYQLGWGRKSIWMFGFTLLPYGTSGFYYVLMHGAGYYVYAIMQVFLVLSLFFAIVNDGGKSKKRLWIKYSIYMGCSLLIGIQGIRLLENLYAPLLLSSIVFFLIDKKRGGEIHSIHQNAREMGSFLKVSLVGSLCACGGYIANRLLLRSIYTWGGADSLQWKEFSIAPIEVLFREIMSNLGFLGGFELFSKKGFTSLAAIVIFAVVVALLVGTCKKGRVYRQDRFIVCFFLAALLVHALAYIFFMQEYKSRYMLPFFMVLPYVIVTIVKEWKPGCKRIILMVLGVCFFLTSVNAASVVHEQGNHKGINIIKQKEMADFLVRNGYQYGFSTFWFSNSTVQLSEGQLKICALVSPKIFEKYEWLSTEEQIDYSWSDKTFFIVSDTELEASKEMSWNQEENIVWHDGGICVFEYASVEELRNAFGG